MKKTTKGGRKQRIEKNISSVSEDTLEFLSLDDETIEAYGRRMQSASSKASQKKAAPHKKKETPVHVKNEKDRKKRKTYRDYEQEPEELAEEDFETEELEEIEDDREYYEQSRRYRYEDEEDDEEIYEDERYEEERYEQEVDEEDEDDEYYRDEDEYYRGGREYRRDEEEEEDDEYYADEEAYYADERYYEEERYYAEEDDEEDEDEDEYYRDEYYEDEEEEEDEEDDEDDYDRGNIFVRFADFIADMSALDHVVMVFGCFILAAAIATGALYAGAKTKSGQVQAFAEIGTEVEDIKVIGESGLLAVSNAESARLSQMMTIPGDGEQDQSGEVQNTAIEIAMNLTSIQSDLKIKFVNKQTYKLVSGIPFEVEVTGDNGKAFTLKDEDKDGIIYQTGVSAGSYTVQAVALAGSDYEKYMFPSRAETIKVTDSIAYQKVDVADEIKSEAEVNVALEDTAKQDTVVESTLTDTVEWVESTRQEVNADNNYYEINKTDIPDPATIGRLGTFMKTGGEVNPPDVGDGDNTGDGSGGNTGDGNGDNTGDGNGGNTGDGSGGSTGDGNGGSTGDGNGGNTGDGNGDTKPPVVDPDPPATKYTMASVSGGGTIQVGKTCTVSGTTNPAGGAITWSSSNASVATVSSSGVVTGVSAGSVTITGTTVDGDSMGCSITVVPAEVVYKSLAISCPSTVQVGKTCTASGTTDPAGGKITWSSSDAKIASVDASSGVVTGVSVGTVKIKGTIGGISQECTVTVTAADVVYKSLSITAPATVQVGKTCTVTGTTDPAGGVIAWSSSDTKIATVNSSGTVTGVAVGTVKIKGTIGGLSKECTITVTAADVIYKSISIIGTSTISVGKKETFKATTDPVGGIVTWSSDNEKVAKVDKNGVVTGVSVGKANIIVSCGTVKNAYTVNVVNSKSTDTVSRLKDKSGNQIYIRTADGKYVEATYADYYKDQKLYLRKADAQCFYTGWQTINGYTYFYDKNGKVVTGEQIIQGAKYSFGSDGKLSSGSGVLGIDVSKWNGSIDWNAVKNSGISYVIIRCGYRGSSTGALIEDPKFRSNIQGAKAAGLKVGVYFFSQAVNEVEAVEEASMVINLVSGYGLNYPVFLDVESSGGRGDKIDAATRTAVCKAFCSTIQNSGYAAGIYANKTWFTSYINTGSLTGYKIWLAQYAAAPSYTATRYDMWQYSSKGKVSGISGNVDMNISYMNY